MRLIVGLGNPGTEYTLTRHNTGMIAVEKWAERLSSDYGWRAEKMAVVYKTPEMILGKAKDKFMNQSGEWVKWLLNYYANSTDMRDLWVVHDDLDIRLGEYKVQFGTGPKDHGGINSIEASLGTKDFWRVRIGVDNRGSERSQPGDEYVLQRFMDEERKVLEKVIDDAVEKCMV